MGEDMSMSEEYILQKVPARKVKKGKAISQKGFDDTGRPLSKMTKTTAASINQTNFP